MYTSRVDAKGNFSFSHLPAGNFEVFVAGLPGGIYVRDVRSGGVDVLGRGLDLTGARPPLQIRLDLGETCIPAAQHTQFRLAAVSLRDHHRD